MEIPNNVLRLRKYMEFRKYAQKNKQSFESDTTLKIRHIQNEAKKV